MKCLDVCDARPRQWWLSPFSLNRMNFLVVVVIGAVLGALDGVGILFEPREPYKWQILSAATLKRVLVALLTGFSLAATTRWWSAMLIGALYGFAFSLVIYLAKGGPKSRDAAICHSERDYHGRIDWPVHR